MNGLLMNEQALRDRCSKARYNILQRAKPRLFKSGPRKGQVRVPGIKALPYNSEQLWLRALAQVGTGAIRCPYCVAIGRPANLIDLSNYVWDHRVPITHGGSHDISNLFCVCEDCNRLKGSMSYDFFVALLSEVEKWDDPRDRSYLHACLRTHGKVIKGFGTGRKKEEQPAPPDVPTTGILALREDW
jgi:5-methylcytosine-specific restriction endonuclease McrA